MWIGIDDTDSVRGGCTTHVLTELVGAARDRGIDLIGLPRLVRLNPNVPWKTRGNAALSARFGHGRGPRRTVGDVGGRPVVSFAGGGELTTDEGREWTESAWAIVRRLSREGEADTDPALVATWVAPPASFYWKAAREIVAVDEARDWLLRAHAEYRTRGSERGLVGALASVAWPGRRRTFELLTYRTPNRIPQPRRVNTASVRRAQARWPSLFLCYDARTRRLMVAPHTPCPILFGLRSRSMASVLRARRAVHSEPVDRWLLFKTNQGTGDHLLPRLAREVLPYTSARVLGRVTTDPRIRPGGHVGFTLADRTDATIECIAFEPTKTLPKVVRALVPGDRLRVWGSRKEDAVLRLEGIEVVRWSSTQGPRLGPRCPRCQRRAGSLGRNRGYRCPGCGRRWPPEAGRPRPRSPPFPPGIFHPTPSARRHLAPLGPEAPMELPER
jgi:tRNA(Ile2)-agmatinylcytidine synthase